MSDQDPATPATPRLNFGAATQQVEVPSETKLTDTAANEQEALEQFNALAERQAQSTVETEEVETQDVSLTGSEEIGNVGEPEAATEEDTPVVEETPSETETEADSYDEATAQSHELELEDETVSEETQVEEQAEPLPKEPAVNEPELEAEAPAAVPAEEADAVVAEDEAVADVEDASDEPVAEPLDEQSDTPVVEAEADASEDASGDSEAVPTGAPVTEEVEVVTGQAKTQEELEAEAIEAHRRQHADEATERLHNTEVGPSIEELKERQADLDKQIKAKQDAEKESVLSQIKTVVTTYGITTEDLVNYLGGYKPKRPGVKAVQKYKDPVSGATWSGRGKAPTWIKGQDYTKFLTTQP